mmetsp:Transcript_18615/g.30370  ORF Transcript_18615/g.30370 Transcript_18615/m.30370 type:complete len:683 (+) Transcript_18615:188-2236(+)
MGVDSGVLGFAAVSVAALWLARKRWLVGSRAIKSWECCPKKTKKLVARDLEEGLGHERQIPSRYIDNIPKSEVKIIRFVLDYLKWARLPVDGLLINGGYVRDLLIGTVPDDLDISLCLVDCESTVTVGWILGNMKEFIADLGLDYVSKVYDITSFKTVEILGDESKNKQLDTAKGVFGIAGCGQSIDIDLMPTIGEEAYDSAHHRIPSRDQRGTPEQDALRRDLTIGSLLVKVCAGQDGTLLWTLLDFYDGLWDLRRETLRAPSPRKITATDWLSEEDILLAKGVGLNIYDPGDVWWIKTLRDDPVRIVRVLRFAAKLDFTIHPTFWKVIPFALESLRSKAAGSRKMTEILKIAKCGNKKLQDFFSLCFRKRFVYQVPSSSFSWKTWVKSFFSERTPCRKTCLASGMFGGKDGKSVAHFLPPVESFNKKRFLGIVRQGFPGEGTISCEELVGCFLAIAIFSSHFGPSVDAQDPWVFEKLFDVACTGLCVSNGTRHAGEQLLSCFRQLRDIEHMQSTRMDEMFEERTGFDAKGVTFAQHILVWETLKVSKVPVHYSHEIIVSMMHSCCETGANLVAQHLEFFRASVSPPLSGKGVSRLGEVPLHLRAAMLNRLQVLCRLQSYDGKNLDADFALELFLKDQCDNLLEDLVQEWYEIVDETKSLRPQYEKPKPTVIKNKKKKKGG